MKVRYTNPDITEAEIIGIVDTLQSRHILAGKKTKRLAESVSAFCGAPYAVCVGSFTDGIERILRLLQIGPEDEVILSAYMHPAAAHAVERVGARVVLVDIEADTYTVSPGQLASVVTPRAKAVILSDIGGVMCDYDQVRQALHEKRHLYQPKNETQAAINRVAIIGDASYSFGSRHDLYQSGQGADFTCFSFQTERSLFVGDGAAVVWRDIVGLPHKKWQKSHIADGLPYDPENEMTDILSSILLSQMSRAGEANQKRHEIIDRYNESIPESVLPLRHQGERFKSNGAVYMARIPGMKEAERDALMRALAAAGVETKVHFKPLPMCCEFQRMGYSIQTFPNAFHQYESEISLPLYVSMTDKAISHVLDSFRRCIARLGFAPRRDKVLVNSMLGNA